jgi:hypothetical protein
MTTAHSKWSASAFEALMLCPGKPTMETGEASPTSVYAAEGTAAHQVLTWCLQQRVPASHFLGRELFLNRDGRMVETRDTAGFEFTCDEGMVRHIQATLDYVDGLMQVPGAVLLVDRRVNYSCYLGVPYDDAWGTLDIAVILPGEVVCIDFKYGRGVEVKAERNPQMSLYTGGVLQVLDAMGEKPERVRLVISQPRTSAAPSEWDCSTEELEAWLSSTARSAVASAMNAERHRDAPDFPTTYLRPNDKSCKFCRAKATCPAARAEVAQTLREGAAPATPDEFDALVAEQPSADMEVAWLAAALKKADYIEDWVKAVRAEAERRMFDGITVPGFKLVAGKKGARTWSDKAQVEEMLKGMRLKVEEMYDMKLISPTSAEKLAPSFDKLGKPKPVKDGDPAPLIGPRQWLKLCTLITQPDGKPHVAPADDPRPAITVKVSADEFDDVSATPIPTPSANAEFS